MKRTLVTLAMLAALAPIAARAQVAADDAHQRAATRFVDVHGTRFAYRTLGGSSGTPLILLQHFTGTLDNWDPAVTSGLAASVPVVLFDNRGIGASQGQTPDNIDAMAADTIAFIEAMGYAKVNILGYSMGGFIAQQVARSAPALVDKLILAGTAPQGGEGVGDIVKVLGNAASMNPDDQKLYLFYTATPASRALGARSLERIHQRREQRDPDTAKPAVQAQLKSILAWAQPDAQANTRLHEIKQPVLVVNGSNDIVVPTINSYTLFRHLPNARLSLYPDSGHGAIFQYPSQFVREASQFLTGVPDAD
jgi:pimeloyl-ACP methyl ester carboxylesterase